MDLKAHVAARARDLGFHAIGFARAAPLIEERERLERWLAEGCHAGMTYLERLVDVRLDPTHRGMLEGARTVVSLAMAHPLGDPDEGGVATDLARFARGLDYHDVVGQRLRSLLADVKTVAPGVAGRALVDSAPLLERAWAVRAGLGWIGRNTCLVHPDLGSGLVLGELVLSVELEPDAPGEDRCGECRACVEACPTEALRRSDGRVLDARRCRSYWTVEARGEAPLDLGDTLFGCDACQTVCPWNARAADPPTPLAPLQRWRDVTLEDLVGMAPDRIDALIRGTALARRGAVAFRASARRVVASRAQRSP